jgi:beta-phosphoglucomutase-like phosphatase (HAD superfamily)
VALHQAGNDVAKLKPDPLIYLTACEKLRVQPSECIVIEDSTVGLKAATAAGMRCIITYTSTGKAESFAEAAFVVDNLDAGKITVPKLLEAHTSDTRYDDRHD